MSPRGRIGRFRRVGRRPDAWTTPHERARTRAAERLEAPLARREEAWLETHLADCVACRAIAEMYAGDRAALRGLRDDAPVPPRDLWARTAARIEREAAHRATSRRLPPRRASVPVLGTLSGLAVVAVVVVATAVSGGLLGGIGREVAGTPGIVLASHVAPQEIALEVRARVRWLAADEDGFFGYNVANIDVVCRQDRQPDCAPFEDGHAKRVTLTATPRFVYQSPVAAQAIVVGTDGSGADAVLVVALPTPDPTPRPSVPASPEATVDRASEPSASVEASATSEVAISSSALPLDSATASPPAASDSASAEPTPATAIAIITNVAVVGRTAAYSPDGAWFAFSARPADGSAGPDIYVWQVGDPQARPITTDHASVFSSWIGTNLLGSRIVAEASEPALDVPAGSPSLDGSLDAVTSIVVSPQSLGQAGFENAAPESAVLAVEPREIMPQTFLLDPATGIEIPLNDAEWQPAVDPSGRAVVAWQGTVGLAEDGLTAAPATGNLVIHPFGGPLESDAPLESAAVASTSPSRSPQPSLSPEPRATASGSVDVSVSPSPEIAGDFAMQVVAAGPIADFDARWDDTGSWLAIWIADPVDAGLGRLSLLRFDPVTGLLDRPEGAPQDVTALPGFSIGFGRLAWASPPGQGGEGSRIQIAAWTANEVGAVESIPVNRAIVVQ